MVWDGRSRAHRHHGDVDYSQRPIEPTGARSLPSAGAQPVGVGAYSAGTSWRESYPSPGRPPRRRRPWLLVILAVVLFGMAGCGVFGIIGLLDMGRPAIEIPDDVPPAAGEPLPVIDIDAPGRTADQLADWAGEAADRTDIPQAALQAYGYAAAVLAVRVPECGITWTTLAGIGSVESNHGRHVGASIDTSGNVVPVIRGLPLDGNGGRAEIRDTDGGELDGDSELDRAMGPMQFIPETWRSWGVDANGDSVASPDNIDDAALSAARYLCARGGAMTTPDGWSSALYAYNLSLPYQLEVRDRAAAYALGIEPQ